MSARLIELVDILADNKKNILFYLSDMTAIISLNTICKINYIQFTFNLHVTYQFKHALISDKKKNCSPLNHLIFEVSKRGICCDVDDILISDFVQGRNVHIRRVLK